LLVVLRVLFLVDPNLRSFIMRLHRSFRPVAETLGVIALCSGIGAMIAVGPLPELNGTPPGGFLEDGTGVEPMPSATVNLGLSGITPPTGDVTPNPVPPVEDYDALYDAVHPTDPTPVAPASAFD
jgi:hypothetical protein